MADLETAFERPLAEREVAELLGVSPNTLKHWRGSARGPKYVKLVRKVAYRRNDLNEWINANVTEPGVASEGRLAHDSDLESRGRRIRAGVIATARSSRR